MERRPINYPQQLVHDFDAVTHVVPTGRCGYCDGTGGVHSIDGEWRGVCTECEAGRALKAPIASGVAWRAYSKAWPEAMSGAREVRRFGMNGPPHPVTIDWIDS